ncbi:MAG TPA: fatty acid desaturase [Bacteroidia bacterium]|nr:fatty acid desaturase [Bacteroidia bacterium]
MNTAWLRETSRVSPWRNLLFLGLDHLCVWLVVGSAVAFDLWRRSEGLPWTASVPVWISAAFVVGILQHRIGLMGHEASHYLLHPDRRWNDLLADWLCFYPVFGTLANYRAKHLAHHLHPNHPERDPNLDGGKFERFYSLFPMARESFAIRYGLGFFWPPFVLSNLLDLVKVIAMGGGAAARAQSKRGSAPVLASRLGLAHFAALVIMLRIANSTGFSVLTTLAACYGLGVVGWALLPRTAFAPRGRSPVDPKWAAFFRMTCYSAFFGSTALILERTGYLCLPAFFVLWIFPLVYVFPYLMLVREIFQHANAGTGDYDNSRIMHVGPVVRWALLGYGNDYHLVHHIYPNVPCYRLAEVHDRLATDVAAYREQVVETDSLPSLLDSLADERGR